MVDHTVHLKIPVSDIENEKSVFTLAATAEQKKELAERFSLQEVTLVMADVTVSKKGPDKSILVEGRVKADVVQSCVVTLEPVKESLDCEFALLVVPEDIALEWDKEEKYLDDSFPEYDALDGADVPIGEIVAQTVSINLNPYPRAEGVELKSEKDFVTVNENELKRPNPFQILGELRGKVRDKS